MPMDNSTYIGKSDASAFELVVPMEALKDTEQLIHILHVESYTVITYEDFNLTGVSPGGADLYLGLRPSCCEFQRIRDQIHEDLPQHRRIPQNLR
jgi:hypothetical protein